MNKQQNAQWEHVELNTERNCRMNRMVNECRNRTNAEQQNTNESIYEHHNWNTNRTRTTRTTVNGTTTKINEHASWTNSPPIILIQRTNGEQNSRTFRMTNHRTKNNNFILMNMNEERNERNQRTEPPNEQMNGTTKHQRTTINTNESNEWKKQQQQRMNK